MEGYDQYIQDFEKELNKDFIIEHFNKLETESNSENPDWNEEILKESDNIKAWSCMKGTHLNPDIP